MLWQVGGEGEGRSKEDTNKEQREYQRRDDRQELKGHLWQSRAKGGSYRSGGREGLEKGEVVGGDWRRKGYTGAAGIDIWIQTRILDVNEHEFLSRST